MREPLEGYGKYTVSEHCGALLNGHGFGTKRARLAFRETSDKSFLLTTHSFPNLLAGNAAGAPQRTCSATPLKKALHAVHVMEAQMRDNDWH